jgi:steroid delta-isomerase-like uncharacterized protein
MMTGEERKALTRQGIDEVVNKGNFAGVDEAFAENYVGHMSDGTDLNGPEEFKQFITALRSAFPDIQYKVEDMACDGDILAVRTSFTGTMTGPFKGMPPTGKKVAMQEALLYRFEGDKIVEEWSFINQMAMLQQLGLVPPTPPPGG